MDEEGVSGATQRLCERQRKTRTLERQHVQEDADLARDDAEAFRVKVLDPLGLALELAEVADRVWGRDELALAAHLGALVTEVQVRDADDEALAEEGPAGEDLLAEHHLGRLLRLLALPRVLDRDDHRRVLAVAVVDVDAVVGKLGRVRQRLHRREAGKGRRAELDAWQKAFDERQAVERRERIDVLGAVAVRDVGEEARDRRRKEVLGLFVVHEPDRLAVRIARALVRAETVLAGWQSGRSRRSVNATGRAREMTRAAPFIACNSRFSSMNGILTTASHSCFLPFMSASNSSG